MSTSGPVKISVVVMTVLLAMPLWAQRYQGRDHHVFHPPVQTKHQSAQSAGNATQTRVAATGNSSASRGREGSSSTSRSNGPSHPQMPSSTDTVHPH